MSRKSLWFGLMLVVFAAAMLTISASAKPKKKKVEKRSGPPTISLLAEPTLVKACANEGRVQLTTNGRSETGRLRYRWSVNGGRLRGDGPNPMWDLTGVAPGVYQAIVDVDDGDDTCVAFSSASVVVVDCPPPPPERPVCPNVSVSCPDAASENAPVTFTANLSGGTAGITPTYNWTISAGRIISGQGTPSITVDTTGLAGQTVRATVDITGFGMPCPASCAVAIPIVPTCHKFDEYYNISRNDEKARLDNFVIQLQGEPGSVGTIFVHPPSKARGGEAEARAKRISDYLINSRGLDASRFTITMTSSREEWLFEFWICPAGARPPASSRE